MTTGLPSLVKYDSPVAIKTKDPDHAKTGVVQETSTDDDLLNSMLPPRTYTEDGVLWVQSVSKAPATRKDVTQLREQLDRELEERRARETGICPIREELYGQCFDELIRQVTINCVERGMLLLQVRNEMKMTIKAYQTLFESGVAFGLRKSLLNEEEKATHEERMAQAAAEMTSLKHQVLEWKNKCAAVEKREAERREQESHKHKEEVDYLENYAQQLKQQLEGMTSSSSTQ